MKREIPFKIAPGTTEELTCSLEAVRPGEFSSQLHLYFDDLGLREEILTVHGVARAADGNEGPSRDR